MSGIERRALITAAALAACSAHRTAGAQPVVFSTADLSHAEHLRDAALTDDTAWALVQELCNQVGARPAGSAADARAVAWAQAAMTRLDLVNVRAESLAMRRWVRGPASARLVAPVQEPLVMLALGNSVAAPPGGIEADVAWYADLGALKADTSERARPHRFHRPENRTRARRPRLRHCGQRARERRRGSRQARGIGAGHSLHWHLIGQRRPTHRPHRRHAL